MWRRRRRQKDALRDQARRQRSITRDGVSSRLVPPDGAVAADPLAGRGAIGRKIREINDFQCIAAIDRKELTRAGNASAKSWRCPFRGGLYRRAQSLKRLPFVPFPAFNEWLKVPPSRPLRRGLVDGGRGPVRHSSRVAARGGIGGRGDAKSGHGARASLS